MGGVTGSTGVFGSTGVSVGPGTGITLPLVSSLEMSFDVSDSE